MTPLVSVCIPTYEGESFIGRTLQCACSQTHSRLQIIVSIDKSEDHTYERCAEHTEMDHRNRLVAHDVRLGWSHNANAALDCVHDDYFFLYFHDDIIEPTYIECLLQALDEHPDAATAHCVVK